MAIQVLHAIYADHSPNRWATRALCSINRLSTNTAVHLAAIAGRIGVEIDYDEFTRTSDETPALANLKPVGSGYVQAFQAAGGLEAALRELKSQFDLSCRHVSGQSLDQRLCCPLADPVDTQVIRMADNPVGVQGSLIILRGTLAPGGAMLKRAAAPPGLLEHEGRAVVFASLADLAARIDDADPDVSADDFRVPHNAQPRSTSGMPEAGYPPIPQYWREQA